MRVQIVLVVLGILPCLAPAQVKNVKIDEFGGDVPYPGTASVAINPRNPLHLVVAAGGSLTYWSKDGGQSWQKQSSANSTTPERSQKLVSDSKGRFYQFYLAASQGNLNSVVFDRLLVQESSDGSLWDESVVVTANESKYQDAPSPVVDSKGNLYVAWTEFDQYKGTDLNCRSRILISSSKNAKKWTPPFVISQSEGDCSDGANTPKGAVPAISTDGKAFVAWSVGGKIWMDRSFDGGTTWLSNDIFVGDQVGGWDLKIPGCKRAHGAPMLVINKSKTNVQNSLCIVWADQRSGENDTDIWITRSFNFGDNWTPVTRVNQDGRGKHQYMPSMAIDETSGFIYIVYYDRSAYDDRQTDVYVAFSVDGGSSFKNIKVSEQPFSPSDNEAPAENIGIAAHKGIIVPVWTRVDGGKTIVMSAQLKHDELVKASQLASN